MSNKLPDLDKIESMVRVVPAPVDAVEQAIREVTTQSALPVFGNPFAASVGNGRVKMIKREGRNPMRAQLHATLESVGDGTKITATAGLPSYARWVGRAAAFIALLIAVVMAASLVIGGRPDDMPQVMYYAFFALCLWMPMVAWLIPGRLVNRSVAQRGELLAHLDKALAPLGSIEDETVERLPAEHAKTGPSDKQSGKSVEALSSSD